MALALPVVLGAPAHAERIKDLGTFQGVRPNQLTGYGIVVGLAGTGDDSLDYATQGLKVAVSTLGSSLPQGINNSLNNADALPLTAASSLPHDVTGSGQLPAMTGDLVVVY